MTTTARIARPVPPTQPDALRWLIKDHNMAMRALNNGIRYAHQIGPMNETVRIGLVEDIAAQRELIAEWYATVEGQAYRVAVATYNAQAATFNAQIKDDRQARTNRREVTKVRSAACSRCFATHAGEC
jgi:hypothetical protein